VERLHQGKHDVEHGFGQGKIFLNLIGFGHSSLPIYRIALYRKPQ
jgi:hypothetical protein